MPTMFKIQNTLLEQLKFKTNEHVYCSTIRLGNNTYEEALLRG